jgi:L-ascorbate metabolism protein UlaG (beta-lactamase superfamily)
VTRALTLIRYATLLLELEGRRLLVDPMLDDAGARPAVENTDNDRRNPLVPLPYPAEEIVANLDAILLTHLHRDHYDDGAVHHLPRDVPLYCQPDDEERLRGYGFDARPVHDRVVHGGLQIARTDGQHGFGAAAVALPPVSGFVVDDLYIAGDTVWCDEVEQAIVKHRPRVAVVNGSAARFVDSEPLVMTTGDIAEVARRDAHGRRRPPRGDQPLHRHARRRSACCAERHRPRRRRDHRAADVITIAVALFDAVEELDFAGPWEVLSVWAAPGPATR